MTLHERRISLALLAIVLALIGLTFVSRCGHRDTEPRALLSATAITVVPDSMHSYLTINGTRSRQICSEGVATSIFSLDNAHTINCFATVPGNPQVIGDRIYLEVSGVPSGGSTITETRCYLEWYHYTHSSPPAPTPWPPIPCERAKRFQIFDANAVNVGQADCLTCPDLPVVKYVHFVPPTRAPRTATATPAAGTPTAVPVTPTSPPPTPTSGLCPGAINQPPGSPVCVCVPTGAIVPCPGPAPRPTSLPTDTPTPFTPAPATSTPTSTPAPPPIPTSTETPAPTLTPTAEPTPTPTPAPVHKGGCGGTFGGGVGAVLISGPLLAWRRRLRRSAN